MNKVIINEVSIENKSGFTNFKAYCKCCNDEFNVHASRYIASFILAGGNVRSSSFNDWLESLEVSKDDIHYITELARNGKLELETSAKIFLQNSK